MGEIAHLWPGESPISERAEPSGWFAGLASPRAEQAAAVRADLRIGGAERRDAARRIDRLAEVLGKPLCLLAAPCGGLHRSSNRSLGVLAATVCAPGAGVIGGST
jgi:hypothetical protein